MKKAKYLYDKDPWMIAEDIPDIDFQFSQIWLSSFVNDLAKSCGKNYKKILCVYKGLNLKFYYGKQDADDFAKHLLKKIIEKPAFGDSINKNIRKYSDKLKKISLKIDSKYLSSLSDKELANFYIKLDELHTTLYSWGWLPNAVDMFHGNFTNYLKSVLRLEVDEDQVNQTLVTLSTFPEKSIVQQEHESFLNLVSLKKYPAKLQQALKTHIRKYFYLKYLWIGKDGVYDEQYYLKEIKHFKENPKILLRKENQIFNQTIKQRAKLFRKLELNKKQIDIFNVYAEFAVTKLYRRDAQIFWSHQMQYMFSELSSRLKITPTMARFMFPLEVKKSLTSGISNKLKTELRKRVKYCVYYADKGNDLIYTGTVAKSIQNKAIKEEIRQDIDEINGETACVGKARGVVRIINSATEMNKMKKGDILVSIATNPDIVPAMKKAAAIVTEQGGITSHAAIVSRELRTPCVIGTKIATKALKDGDLVEVDAYRGIVKKIKK